MQLSSVLEKRRSERGITYAELGRRTKISGEMTSRFCKGIAMPNGEQLLRLCAELKLEIEDFSDEDAPYQQS